MKKICLISDRNPYMKRFCSFLSENDYEIALICRHPGGIAREQFPQNITFYQLSSTSWFVKRREIPTFIRTFNPDIVHLHYLAKDCLIPALKWRRKYRYLISVWGSDINVDSKKLLNRIVQNLGLLLCDKIHLLSSYFEDKIFRLYKCLNRDKIQIFSWGVAYDFIKIRTADEEAILRKELRIGEIDPIILSYRNHKEIYNHHTLLRAVPAVIQKYPRAKFVFTRGSCDPAYLNETYKLVDQLSLSNHFIFIDRWLGDKELRTLRNIAAIIINIPFEDGLPATLLEIMATTAIPIVGNLENYKSFFSDKENGFLLNDLNDHETLSKLIMEILANPEVYKKKFSRKNNAYIDQEQNWQKQSILFLDLYASEN